MQRPLQLVVASTLALVVFAILVHPVFDGPDAALRLERLTILFLAVLTAVTALAMQLLPLNLATAAAGAPAVTPRPERVCNWLV